MDKNNKTLCEIIIFLALTIIFSALAYIPIIQGGSLNGTQSNLAGFLMLAPGLAAIITYLVFEHSVRPIGWRPGKIQYLVLGLVIPFLYCLLGYGFIWMIGLGKYNAQFPADFPFTLLVLLFNGALSAILEEVAWRGFLVPQMIRVTNFTKTALITGLIWAAWHYPLIIFTNVRPVNTPLQYSLACFTIFVIGVSFATAWLRLKSGSVWPSVLLHSSHNVFMLKVFNCLTVATGSTWLFLGEYGVVTAAIGLFLVILFWSERTRLPAKGQTIATGEIHESIPTFRSGHGIPN
jgi:membrane protease YdiL (CAAX protease family)